MLNLHADAVLLDIQLKIYKIKKLTPLKDVKTDITADD